MSHSDCCHCHRCTHECECCGIEKRKYIQNVELENDPVEDMLNQISIDINSSSEHPICALLDENIKAANHLMKAVENFGIILANAPDTSNILPYSNENYINAEIYRAQLEGYYKN